MPDMRFAVNGITVAAKVEGNPAAPCIVLLHGFPDSSKLWNAQVPVLMQHGFRVVAPDLRGFGQSSKPPDIGAYALRHAQADVLAVLDALGIDNFYLVGHDWGSALAWRIAATVPSRIKRLVAISVGHPGGGWGAGGAKQRSASWYFLLFQYEGVAEKLLQADDWQLFREFMGPTVNPQDMAAYISDLSRPGALTAGLAWYRANFHVEHFGATRPALHMPKVGCPVMGVWSTGDKGLLEPQMLVSSNFVPEKLWRYEKIEGAGHWVPRDAPEHLNNLLLQFLPLPQKL
ncbi:g2927 [Coccomyxa elongata]